MVDLIPIGDPIPMEGPMPKTDTMLIVYCTCLPDTHGATPIVDLLSWYPLCHPHALSNILRRRSTEQSSLVVRD